MNKKPLVGISTCLLGENVRYDGGHKLDSYLRDTLGKYVEYVPVCPEAECGMSIPREAVHLVEIEGEIRLMTLETNRDMTEQMNSWMRKKLAELTPLPLCGFIFKAKSPSCGLKRIKVHRKNGVTGNGVGMFARGVTDALLYLPVEEDDQLHDEKLRENFIERIFFLFRWHQLTSQK